MFVDLFPLLSSAKDVFCVGVNGAAALKCVFFAAVKGLSATKSVSHERIYQHSKLDERVDG